MPESKNKRAASRYPYLAQGECSKDDRVFPCALQDISVSGIQIECAELLELDQQVFVSWEDPTEGKIEGVFYVIRQFEKPDALGKYFYGLRYYQLDQFSKQNVLNLLNGIKNQTKQQTEKISLDVIYAVVDEGKAYIEKHITDIKAVHPFFFKPLESLQPYEKEVFTGEYDPYQEIITDFVTSYFQAVLLKNVVPFAVQKSKRLPDLFQRVIAVIDASKELEEKEEAIFDYVKDKDDAADLKVQYNQSTNRLFYAQQAMMEKVVKTLASAQLVPELKEKLDYISEHYDHTIELTNPNIGLDDIHTVSKRPPGKKKGEKKKDAKYNKKDSQYYVPNMEKKGAGKIIVLALILLGIAGMYSYKYFNVMQQTSQYQVQLTGLPIPVKKAMREGSQLYLDFEAADWASLDEKKIKEIRAKVQAFLVEDKWLRTAIIKASTPAIKMIITTLV